MSKDKFSMANELNRAKKITSLNLRHTISHDLTKNFMMCEIFSASHYNLKFIELRLAVLGGGELKDFNFYVDDQIISTDSIMNDNKSIFLELPVIADKLNTKEFCIKNISSETKQLQINKFHQQIHNSSSKLIFSYGALGLGLMYKKDEN